MRIFVVTQSESDATNMTTMENYVKDVLDAVRLPAEVVVINLGAHTASQPFALPDRFRLRLQRITFQPADSPKENGETVRSIDPRFFARSVSVNRHIREHSLGSSLVFMSLPSSKLADVNPELYMLNLDILMDAVGRGIWVKGYSRLDIISREQ